MAAIVAYLLYVPVGALVALVSYAFAVPLAALMTFGGAFDSMFFGFLMWWLVAFACARVYAAFAFPWKEKVLAWPKKI